MLCASDHEAMHSSNLFEPNQLLVTAPWVDRKPANASLNDFGNFCPFCFGTAVYSIEFKVDVHNDRFG